MAVLISGKQPAATNCDPTSIKLGITHSNCSGDPLPSPLRSTEANGLGARSEIKAQSEV